MYTCVSVSKQYSSIQNGRSCGVAICTEREAFFDRTLSAEENEIGRSTLAYVIKGA